MSWRDDAAERAWMALASSQRAAGLYFNWIATSGTDEAAERAAVAARRCQAAALDADTAARAIRDEPEVLP